MANRSNEALGPAAAAGTPASDAGTELPLEIALRDVAGAGTLEALIRRRTRKLSRVYEHISSCRVAVERTRRRSRSSDPHRVRIDLTVPRGNEIVVTEQTTDGDREAPQQLVRRAFDAVERRLKELKARQRYAVKTHDPPRALVARIFREEGYGFLRTLDGRDVYFHENSVLAGAFDRLEPGTEVRFEEEEGEDGPQASTVAILGKPGSTSPH